MNWALHLLGCNPEIQEKAHQELDAVFGDEARDVDFDDLKNLPYLECCLKEALRLFPSVPMFARTLHEDATIGKFDFLMVRFLGLETIPLLGGLEPSLRLALTVSANYVIPSGTQVVIYPYLVHRDPKHWPDPEIYNPDRFLAENSNGRHPYAYLPFSAGARNCIGKCFVSRMRMWGRLPSSVRVFLDAQLGSRALLSLEMAWYLQSSAFRSAFRVDGREDHDGVDSAIFQDSIRPSPRSNSTKGRNHLASQRRRAFGTRATSQSQFRSTESNASSGGLAICTSYRKLYQFD